MKPKILAFNINVKNTVLCDNYYNNKTTMEIPEEGFLFKRRQCKNPLFFDDIEEAIISVQPTIVVITTEEIQRGYFHSDFLPLKMQELNYVELSTYQYNALNMSIYVQYTNNFNIIGSNTYTYGNNVDSLAIYCDSPYGTIAFIALTKPNSPTNLSAMDVNKLIKIIVNQYSNNVTNAIITGYIDKKDLVSNYIDIINVGPGKFTMEKAESTAVVYGTHEGLMTLFSISTTSPKILCFSWNTDKTPLCDQYHARPLRQSFIPRDPRNVRKGFFQDTLCYSPTFFTQVYDKIKEESPDIVVIHTEGDLEKGTFFHHQFLKDHMKHYYLLDNDKVTGIGTINDPEALRMSIYVRNDTNVTLDNINATLFYKNNKTNCSFTINGTKVTSKAIVKFVSTPYGVIAFMGLQFPHEYTEKERNECFNIMTNKLLASNKISYIFIMGDFSSKEAFIKVNGEIINQDVKQFGYNELELLPNYKLKPIMESQRNNTYFNKNKYNPKFIQDNYSEVEWHDRIFYNTRGPTTYEIKCTYYDNVFGFPMLNSYKNSHHLGVMGVFKLDKVTI